MIKNNFLANYYELTKQLNGTGFVMVGFHGKLYRRTGFSWNSGTNQVIDEIDFKIPKISLTCKDFCSLVGVRDLTNDTTNHVTIDISCIFSKNHTVSNKVLVNQQTIEFLNNNIPGWKNTSIILAMPPNNTTDYSEVSSLFSTLKNKLDFSNEIPENSAFMWCLYTEDNVKVSTITTDPDYRIVGRGDWNTMYTGHGAYIPEILIPLKHGTGITWYSEEDIADYFPISILFYTIDNKIMQISNTAQQGNDGYGSPVGFTFLQNRTNIFTNIDQFIEM